MVPFCVSVKCVCGFSKVEGASVCRRTIWSIDAYRVKLEAGKNGVLHSELNLKEKCFWNATGGARETQRAGGFALS